MANTSFESVDDYLATMTPATRKVLEKVRTTIRKALPKAEEAISYQIPAYKVAGKAAIYFAGWKTHYSVYPVGERALAEIGDELAKHVVSKGTIKFELDEPVPTKLIAKVAKARAAEVEALVAAKKPKRAKG